MTPIAPPQAARCATRFQPEAVSALRFDGFSYDEPSATARFEYSFDTGERFTESFRFHGAPTRLDPARRRALLRCLEMLYLVAGVSYYKAAVPPRIELASGPLPESTAAFLEELYFRGLGEFAYQNRIDLRGRVRFPFDRRPAPRPDPLPLPRRCAVPIGGGKDSVVALEMLREMGEELVLFSLGRPRAIREVCALSGLPHVYVERKISSELLRLNRIGAYNGHVPISAIICFTLACAGVLYGFDRAALANERSANSGNLYWQGSEVNHQFSKSLDFEAQADTLIGAELLEGFRYFSLLRPLSELHIARLFARATAYHPVFTSCNAAFRIAKERRVERWCRDCPKCRFVFLALAPFLPKSALLGIVGADLLADPAQLPGYEELLGLRGHKPFECVGEVRESRVAVQLLEASGLWPDSPVLQALRGRWRKVDPAPLFDLSGEHRLPRAYGEYLRAYCRA